MSVCLCLFVFTVVLNCDMCVCVYVCARVRVRVGVGVGVCARLCLCCVPTCLHACMHVLCVYVGSENRVYPKSNGLSSFSLLDGHVGGYLGDTPFSDTPMYGCACVRVQNV